MDRSKNALPDQSKVTFVVLTYMVLEKKVTPIQKCVFTNYLPPLILRKFTESKKEYILSKVFCEAHSIITNLTNK